MDITLCRWNHAPPSTGEYDNLPHGIGGWTIAAPFFEEVEDANCFGVNKQGVPYSSMKTARDDYEEYYDERMSDISDIVDELSTSMSKTSIELRLSSIAIKISQIDTEYLATAEDMIELMDDEDEDLLSDYGDYLDNL